MKINIAILIAGGLIFTTVTSRADEPKITSAGTLNLQGLDVKDWPKAAQKELHKIGPIVGIPGGVTRNKVIYNQRNGEDCWSFALNSLLESYLISKGFSGADFKLSPDYVEFWHIYEQIHSHLNAFKKIAAKIAADPENNSDLIKQIQDAYGVSFHNREAAKDDGDLFKADVGNQAPDGIKEIEKFGVAPYRIVKGRINSDQQETDLENEINKITGELIIAAAKGQDDLDSYKETSRGHINEKLYQILKARLEPIMGANLIRPTDSWTYEGHTYTPLSTMKLYKQKYGFDLKHDWQSRIATPETHEESLKAIAIALLSKNLPVPFGIGILADKVAGDKSVLDFAQATGLFTSSVCAAPKCQKEDGGHEILAVNFLAQATDDVPTDLSSADKIQLLQDGTLKVTALIIQNSWGARNSKRGRLPCWSHRRRANSTAKPQVQRWIFCADCRLPAQSRARSDQRHV